MLPELSRTKRVDGIITARIIDKPKSNYDIILGMNVLKTLGLDALNSTEEIQWCGEHRIAYRPRTTFKDRTTVYASMI